VRTVTVSTIVEGPGIEAEQLWYDRSRWPSWIAGFAALQKLGEEWPLEGARRVWVTRPQGRGLISETVRSYVAGDGLALEFEDAKVRGVQRVRFESDGARTLADQDGAEAGTAPAAAEEAENGNGTGEDGDALSSRPRRRGRRGGRRRSRAKASADAEPSSE